MFTLAAYSLTAKAPTSYDDPTTEAAYSAVGARVSLGLNAVVEALRAEFPDLTIEWVEA